MAKERVIVKFVLGLLFTFSVGFALAVASQPSAASISDAPPKLRLGYFANVTHATAIYGVEKGLFAKALEGRAQLETLTFNAGPSAIEALLSGALDATYIGPNPAINGFVKSRGEALRVVCGATSGGAFLVVVPEIESAEQLRGKRLATPQLGGTQDVALRAWLKSKGFKVELTGASDVQVVPQENAQTLEQFRERRIQGAWVPEPWATRLVLEGGGKVLVDERELWPEGRFVTTHLIVRSEYLREHPQVIRALIDGHLDAQEQILAQPAPAQEAVNVGIARITGKRIAPETIQRAWSGLTFTHDPLPATLVESARAAVQVGLLKLDGVDVLGIYDLAILNERLANRSLAPVVVGAGK